VADASSAPDLEGFATREWLTGLFDPEQILTEHYYGGTRFAERSGMVRIVQRDVADFDDEQKRMLEQIIKALSAEAALPAQAAIDSAEATAIVEGRELIKHEDMRCLECHNFHTDYEDNEAPNLTGYGSLEWTASFIANPAHERFYGRRNDRMPAFAEDNTLTPLEIELLARWLRGDWPRTAPQASSANAE
jgi:mono/diheme cytochrome c family protein